ncbi:hypothetical protein GCM10027048_27500 [Hymenobacter coalescens]
MTRTAPASIAEALASLATYNYCGNGVYKQITLADGSVATFVRNCSSEPWRARS